MLKKFFLGLLVGSMLLQNMAFAVWAVEEPQIIIEELEPLEAGATIVPKDETGIPDEGLYTALLETLGYPEEGVLTVSMLESIPSLVVGGWQVESLKGLEYCKNLEELYIYEYTGNDVAPLAELTGL